MLGSPARIFLIQYLVARNLSKGKKVIKELIENSYLFGGNAPYVEDLYEQYLEDPNLVDEKWREFFDRIQHSPAVDGKVETHDVAHAPNLDRLLFVRLMKGI